MKSIKHSYAVPFTPFLFFALILSFGFSACKSKPFPAPETPAVHSASLAYTGIEAADPDHLSLMFRLESTHSSQAKIESWRAEINGQKAGSALSLEAAGNSLPAPLKLSMDMAALEREGLAPFDEYNVKLIIKVNFFSGGEAVIYEVSSIASFPGVKAPEFSITSIAVIKAELINTRFRVNMKIDNPNLFPVSLSSFAYELYGNSRLWADGSEKNVFTVPAKSSMTAELYLLMNFINMERSLLDQIIKLVDVNYRFTGDVQVSTGLEYLPVFNSGFDLSGYSQVLEK